MSADHPHPTPEQAREQLAAIRTRPLPAAGDHRIHAIATAVLGLNIAFYFAADNIASGAVHVVLSCLFFAVCLAETIWVERSARTVPRRAKLWSRLGIGVSLVLTLFLVLPWLNLQARNEPNTWWMVLLGTVVAAAPSLVAAGVIARGRK